ncbi:MAG TPA: alpha/beta hydrolase family protein, partial [Agriterribacter sp.]|nr:alpha/beta hydrolase family protein [Agriterribacter sp.]
MKSKNCFSGLIALAIASAVYLPTFAQGTVSSTSTTKQLPVDYTAHFQNQAHFDTLYQYAAMEYAFKGKTKADFLKWQSAFRPVLKEKLGLTTIEKQLPGYIPKVEKRNVEDKGDYLLERWLIWTEPTVPLPFILLRPKNIKGKVPLVITPHGHGKNTEVYAGVFTSEADSIHNMEGERDVAVQAVKQGYLAIAPTTRAFGETRTQKDIKEDKTHSCHI